MQEQEILIRPQPYASWTLDSNDDWQAPVTKPTDESLVVSDTVILRWCYWSEENYRWQSENVLEDPMTSYHWDTNTNTWEISQSLLFSYYQLNICS